MNFYFFKPILKFLFGTSMLISSVLVIRLLFGHPEAIGKSAMLKNDSSLVNSTSLKRIPKDVKDIPDKAGKETRSTLNSVNLIIYMINKVTNKSLR